MAQSKTAVVGLGLAHLIFAVGCNTPSPVAMSVTERASLGAALALAVVAGGPSPPPTPAPGPSPAPARICPECNNQGWVGDGTIKLACPNPNCPVASMAAFDVPPPAPARMSGTRWTVDRQRNYTTEELASHLAEDHGVDPAGYTRDELQVMHDNIHNGFPALGGAKAATRSSSSCPNGNCPTSRRR